MTERINIYRHLSSEPGKALLNLGKVDADIVERPLLELVRVRASQLNGCAYCIDMHTKVARAAGESEQRLYALSAWREAPFFTNRERAALEWTEALTRMGEHGVSSELRDAVRSEFSEKELVDLSLAVCVINAWNRLSIAFGSVVGSYELPQAQP